jgi:hypothetical protein
VEALCLMRTSLFALSCYGLSNVLRHVGEGETCCAGQVRSGHGIAARCKYCGLLDRRSHVVDGVMYAPSRQTLYTVCFILCFRAAQSQIQKVDTIQGCCRHNMSFIDLLYNVIVIVIVHLTLRDSESDRRNGHVLLKV